MNSITITGHIGKIGELKETNGKKYISLTIADNRWKDKTNWWNITAFGNLAELISKYCCKGNKVTVCGEIELSTYENKEGQKVNTHTVLIHAIDLPSKNEATNQATETQQPTNNKPEEGDDLPF